jgi:hypothetical protein
MFYVVFLGLLLQVSSDQPSKRRRGKNNIHHLVWSLLLYLHVVWPQKRWSDLPEGYSDMLSRPLGKRVEAYVDDVVIKTENSENFIEDYS